MKSLQKKLLKSVIANKALRKFVKDSKYPYSTLSFVRSPVLLWLFISCELSNE